MKIVAAIILSGFLVGCGYQGDTVTGSFVPEPPPKLDCDLIFPAPAQNITP
jgi:hypothetical protein